MARKTIHLRQGFNNSKGRFIMDIPTDQDIVERDMITGLYEIVPADDENMIYSIPVDNIASIETNQ